MSKDMLVGLVIGIVTTGCVAIHLHYALTHNGFRRAARIKQGIVSFWSTDDAWADGELDDAAIADQAALGIRDITKFLKKQKEAGQ